MMHAARWQLFSPAGRNSQSPSDIAASGHVAPGRTTLKYMLLIHHDAAALAAAPQRELWGAYAAFNEALAKAGATSGVRLDSANAATLVRTGAGKTEVLDGPYIDTKEQLAGYFFVDAASIEEAVTWAERCPSSRYGTIEIRPVVEG